MFGKTRLGQRMLGLVCRNAGVEMGRQSDGPSRRQVLRRAAGAAAIAGSAGWGSCHDPDLPHGGKVIIVGGGLAGLACGIDLAEAGVPVELYEAADEVGGRTLSFVMDDGQGNEAIGELGGELIDSDHDAMLELIERSGLTLIDRFAEYLLGMQKETWVFNDGTGDVEVPSSVLDTQYAAVVGDLQQWYLDAESDDTLYCDYSYTSLGDMLDQLVPSALYPELHAALVSTYRDEFGRDVYEQDALNLIYLIYPFPDEYDDSNKFYALGFSDERYTIAEGMSALIAWMRDTFVAAGGQITCGYKLTEVNDCFLGGYTSRFDPTDGVGFPRFENADFVVCAVPHTALRNVDFSGVSDWAASGKPDILDGIGMGASTKVKGGFFSRPWWDVHNASGALTNDDWTVWDSSVGREGALNLLTNWTGAAEALAAESANPVDRFNNDLLPRLEPFWSGTTAAFSGIAQTSDWNGNPLFGGSYSVYLVGGYCEYWSLEGEPVGNIHFCGEWTDPDYQGWMNGGANTGRLVAAAVMANLEELMNNGNEVYYRSSDHRRTVAMATMFAPMPQFRGHHGTKLPGERRNKVARLTAIRRGRERLLAESYRQASGQ